MDTTSAMDGVVSTSTQAATSTDAPTNPSAQGGTAEANSNATSSTTSTSDTAAAAPKVPEDVVHDVDGDIAMNEFGEKMAVGVAGRARFQKIFILMAPNGKRSSDRYTAPTGPPKPNEPAIPILPTSAEREGRPNTAQSLVVGLVLANDPSKYSDRNTGIPRNKAREDARKARGVLPPETNVLRAIIPITPEIPNGNIKFYVAVNQVHGLCSMRLITQDTIFYFAEFAKDVPTDADTKSRRAKLSKACKEAAALEKKHPDRAITKIVESGDLTPSNSLSVTRDENDANLLFMQYSIWQACRDDRAMTSLKETMKRILPEVSKRPAKDGTAAFFDFENAMEREDAEKLIEEIMGTVPDFQDLKPELITAAHSVLCKETSDGEEVPLGYQLPYKNLPLFLEWLHDRTQAEWEPRMFNDAIRKILHDVKIVNKRMSPALQWTPSKRPISELESMIESYQGCLTALRKALREIVTFLRKTAKELREQHGGILLRTTMDDLMLRIGATIDQSAFSVLSEQVFAVHAEQLASGNAAAANCLEEKLIPALNMALGNE